MKIKTSELTGAALDWAVAKALNIHAELVGAFCNPGGFEMRVWNKASNRPWQPSASWEQGGFILEQYGLWLSDDNDQLDLKWIASFQGSHIQTANKPLIAAMRALVAAKLGDEIEVPDELAQAAADAEG